MGRKLLWVFAAMAGLPAMADGTVEAPWFTLVQQARPAFTVEGAGARAMGTGGAFTAMADDATAVSYNPAGLAQLLRPELSLVAGGFRRDLGFTGFAAGGGSPASYENTATQERSLALRFASFALPWPIGGRNCVFLLSYQKAFDLTYHSDVAYLASANYGTTTEAIAQRVAQDGGMAAYSASLGVEASRHILLGLALNSWQGRAAFSSFSRRSVTGINLDFDSELAQDSSFHGLNATLGAIWRSERLRLGLTWRTPFRATYVFTDRYDHIDTTTGDLVSSTAGAVRADLKWPETWTGGVGLRVVPRLLAVADWSFTPWSQATFAGTGTALDGQNWFDLQRLTRTPKTTCARYGLEWLAVVRPGLVMPARIGAFREPQPVVDPRTGAQRLLEGWTLGLGLKLRDLTLDAAIKVSHGHRFISRYNTDAPSGGLTATAYGYEHLDEVRVYLSCIYQLQTEAVRRAIFRVLE